MTIDARARAAASDYQNRSDLSVDVPAMFGQLQKQRGRQSRVAWVAAAAVTAFVVATAGWLALRPQGVAENQPINRQPLPTVSPSPTPEDSYLNSCGAIPYDECNDASGELSTVLSPERRPMGGANERWRGPTIELTLDMPPHWRLEAGFPGFLDLRTGHRPPGSQVGVMVMAGPVMPFGREGGALNAKAMHGWIASHPDLSVSELKPTELDGSPAWQMTVSGPGDVPLFMIPEPNSWPGSLFLLNQQQIETLPFKGLKSQQQETVIVSEEETGWPLVVRVLGQPQLVDAHTADIEQLIDSITISR